MASLWCAFGTMNNFIVSVSPLEVDFTYNLPLRRISDFCLLIKALPLGEVASSPSEVFSEIVQSDLSQSLVFFITGSSSWALAQSITCIPEGTCLAAATQTKSSHSPSWWIVGGSSAHWRQPILEPSKIAFTSSWVNLPVTWLSATAATLFCPFGTPRWNYS